MSESNEPARTVVLSYPADLSGWGRDIVEATPFRAYLCRIYERAEVGDEWAEFVGVGCCGDTLDVPLHVEAVDGGASVGESTEFAFEERDACDLPGGWQVQSESGP